MSQTPRQYRVIYSLLDQMEGYVTRHRILSAYTAEDAVFQVKTEQRTATINAVEPYSTPPKEEPKPIPAGAVAVGMTPFERLVYKCETQLMTCASDVARHSDGRHSALQQKATLMHALAWGNLRDLEDFRQAGGGWPDS